MSDETTPFFRFNPTVYNSHRSLRPSDAKCDLCGQTSGWRYVGNVYAIAPPEVLCARCIANGWLASCLGSGKFTLHDIVLDDCDPAFEREILERTPGVACFNPYVWPVDSGRPLAFIGYGSEVNVLQEPKVGDAISVALVALGMEPDRESDYALVFRDLDNAIYRAVIDFD